LDKDLLFQILSTPTAPYREFSVRDLVMAECERHHIAHFLDPIGNLILGAGSLAEYRRKIKGSKNEPVRFFIAHMDHPGFHGTGWTENNLLEVKWFGGGPRAFIEGASVWISTGEKMWPGVFRFARMNSAGTNLETALVDPLGEGKFLRGLDPKTLFGGYSFREPVWEDNGLLYTKAADDLIGVFTILFLAKKAAKGRRPFLGLLSRAEEVGFIGTVGHFELGWAQPKRHNILVVSLETSRTLPGALVGKGPVVRLGDKAGPFDPAGTLALTEAAKSSLKDKFQRRIMDGGTCEATAALIYGFRAVGISVPLGNYHNQNFEGGPDARGPDGPAPEFVALSDIEGMMSLCEAILKPGWKLEEAWKTRKKDFALAFRRAKTLLKC
jgi:putative aminopeptidase FrvX